MKYKVGDIIRIKENDNYRDIVKEMLESQDPPYVMTIEEIISSEGLTDMYRANEYDWYDGDIKDIYVESIEEVDPINNRFEILDL